MASNEDSPPNSRLFIVCSKKDELTENDFKNSFSKFGTIEDIWFVRDKSGNARGLCYVKFSKSSEACKALEEMNGGFVKNSDFPLKIIIAANRSEGSVRKTKEAEALNRIFVVVPEGASVDTLKCHFSQFGHINHVLEVRNGKFAYLTFSKSSEAALALEECDRLLYKPRIADPPNSSKKRRRERSPSPPVRRRRRSTPPPPSNRQGMVPRPYMEMPRAMEMPRSTTEVPRSVMMAPERRMTGPSNEGVCLINNPTRCCQLYLKVNYPLSRNCLWKLCGLIPGLEYIELHQEAAADQKTIAYVKYDSPASAAWAWEKLQDFEYPPGYMFRIRYADAGLPADWLSEFSQNSDFRYQSSNVVTNGGTYYQESSSSFGRPHSRENVASSNHPPKSSVKLGPPLPLLPRDTAYTDRCFFVCTGRIPQSVLEDTFSSFGDLIEIFYLGSKNCGFATFASVDSADKAISTLNGTMLYGEKLKVVRADPEPAREPTKN